MHMDLHIGVKEMSPYLLLGQSYREVADDITHYELSFLLETPRLIFNTNLMNFEPKYLYSLSEIYNKTSIL